MLDKKDFQFKIFHGLDDELKTTLKNQYQIEELDIEDVFTSTQLSKREIKKDYLYIALQCPEYDKDDRKFLNKEIHCIVSERYFLIIDKNKKRPNRSLFEEKLYSVRVMKFCYGAGASASITTPVMSGPSGIRIL